MSTALTKSEFVAMVKRDRPELRAIPDHELPDAVGEALLTRGPGADLIARYFAEHRISAGLFLGFLNRWRATQEAERMKQFLESVKAAAEAQTLLKAIEKGVPRENLGDYRIRELEHDHVRTMAEGTRQATVELKKLEHEHVKELVTHQTEEQIRAERERLKIQKELIDHDVSAKRELAQFESVSELHDARQYEEYIDRLIDQIAELEAQPPSKARDEKLAFRRKTLKAKQKEYHERFGG